MPVVIQLVDMQPAALRAVRPAPLCLPGAEGLVVGESAVMVLKEVMASQ